MQNVLQLNPDKSDALMIGTANQLHTVSSTVTSLSVAGLALPVADQMKVLGVILDQRLTFEVASFGGSSIMLLPRTSHPSYTPSTDDRTRHDPGVQPDTYPPGLL